jgi:signal transduction histidine kinase
MIDTLREYTRADGHVTFGPVEMGQVMEDMLSNLDHVIRARGARVTYAWLPVVTGNSSQLTQLLQNLVGNAIKYCEAAVPTVDIAASPGRGDAWLFAVKDNGIGIPEESYRRVFEPFKRLDEAGKYEGTGLGLATCKKIVERHGDVIWCKSSEEGTTFFFTLPAAGAVAESLSSRSVRPTLEESSHADSKTGPLKKG